MTADVDRISSIASIVTVVAGLLSLVVLWEDRPPLAYIGFFAIASGLAWIVFRYYNQNFRKTKAGIRGIIGELKSFKYQPDILVPVGRSGTILAGMLAVNMGIEEIISITRTSHDSPDLRSYEYGSLFEINKNKIQDKRLLVVFFVVNTGKSLEEALHMLESVKADCEIRIATLYCTKACKLRWRNIISAYTGDSSILERQPWVLDKYHYM